MARIGNFKWPVEAARNRGAFTLVELLVVLAILSLLIALLLPILGKAMRAGESAKCLANLRQIGQAMTLYANDHRGAIAGSGNTSGRYLYPPGTLTNASVPAYGFDDLPPGPIALADYIAPLAQCMNLSLPDSPSATVRYDAYRRLDLFLCPGNAGLQSVAYTNHGQPDAGPGRVLGYATAYSFLLVPSYQPSEPIPGVTHQTRISGGAGWWELPRDYFPSLTKITRPSEKVFAADACKFASPGVGPTYNLDLAPYPHDVGACSSPYSDYGPFTRHTRAYDRTVANGGGGIDCRVLSYAHGSRIPGDSTGGFRLNAVFFDGHAESIDEVRSMDPALWLPSGTVIPDGSKIWPDVSARYISAYPYSVP